MADPKVRSCPTYIGLLSTQTESCRWRYAMYAVAANGPCRSNVDAKRRLRAAMPLLLSLAAPSALALDQFSPATATSSATGAPDQRMRPLQLEVSASSLPRFDNIDGSTRASRIDLTLLPRRLALGLSLGMTNMTGSTLAAGGPYRGATPSVDLGFHW